MALPVRVMLRYANGRTHAENLPDGPDLAPGADFDLYGHHWHAVAWTVPRSRYEPGERSLVCELADPPREASRTS